MIKVFVAEDHQLLREGLISLLNEDPEIKIVGEASDGKEAIEKISTLDVDVAIMDINMPNVNGLEATTYIKNNFPDVKVLALSILDHENYVSKMFKAGATGYALKNIGKEELLQTVKRIHKGEIYISPEIASHLVEKLKTGDNRKTKLNYDFSKKEIEVLSLIADGHTNQEIADKLSIGKRTIETYRMNLIEKTGTRNTASLIKYAVENKIIC